MSWDEMKNLFGANYDGQIELDSEDWKRIKSVVEAAIEFERNSHDYPEQTNFWVSEQKAFLNSQSKLAKALAELGVE